MSYTFDPSFGRGQVLGVLWKHPIEGVDTVNTGVSTVGRKKDFTDVNAKTGVLLSNEIVTCVALRNTTAAAVLPGANLTLNGYVGVVDEYVKPTGVPVNEIFWLVVAGPTQQPLGTRINLMTNGTPVPRMIVPLGTADEVPENVDTNPAVRVVFEEAEDAAVEPTPTDAATPATTDSATTAVPEPDATVTP